MATIKRIIPPRILKSGVVEYHSVTSPPDDSIAMCHKVPDRIIPVIFVPGVMGSNLQSTVEKKGDEPEPVWVVNSTLGVALSWAFQGAETRKKLLDPAKTELYRAGDLPADAAPRGVFHTHPAPTQEEIDQELRRRGWGEVSHLSYGPWLKWLEESLNDADYSKSGMEYASSGLRPRLMKELVANAPGIEPLTFDEVGLSYRYQFPVHAVGYNWLQSNSDSAIRLEAKIDEFIAYYNRTYVCQNVILVTHSMGGLVARFCTEELAQRDKVLGVVHGVMPATGAATAYKRVKAGVEGVAGIVVGDDAAKVTAVFAQAPGPLQLLPSREYGNGWLKIKNGDQRISLPLHNDPYGEIYTVRGKWWGLIDDKLINPMDPERKTVESDWNRFKNLINGPVRKFHDAIAHRYHPVTYAFYGDDKAHSTWGDVLWERKPTLATGKLNFVKPSEDIQSSRVLHDSGQGQQVLWLKTGNTAMPSVFTLAEANEHGDGTVPIRSGKAPQGKVRVCVGYPGVEHEGAYKEEKQRLFTLWSIVKIAQQVKPPLRYEIDGDCPP
ncbi:pimeloyl-ACP methyl ester carboxylesterase [Herbaspirillum sp. Sphag1AN]|uniref:lipase/acyltransferase domain-containing protein n=1 Tax=unclassified Herbaspirillum TaxID=2624150 RepID=UPI001615566E|nr:MULTISPECIES: hypothetical protein [unclassified Herbaspirillum]MBB3212205.1 pimeloyl-ACP methyl ester carboxylesterase [Herbaspirillum sp. Sphag1AN]MBB3245697.1 pimeloyl-ACP methyl ester carboxylesterase [Herbaspirillum sp. Sphag64]